MQIECTIAIRFHENLTHFISVLSLHQQGECSHQTPVKLIMSISIHKSPFRHGYIQVTDRSMHSQALPRNVQQRCCYRNATVSVFCFVFKSGSTNTLKGYSSLEITASFFLCRGCDSRAMTSPRRICQRVQLGEKPILCLCLGVLSQNYRSIKPSNLTVRVFRC